MQGLSPSRNLAFPISYAPKETFETFVRILKECPEKLEAQEVKKLLPIACELLAPKMFKVFDTYIASHLEEFHPLEIEGFIEKYFAFLEDTKNQYAIHLISERPTSITQLVMLYTKGKKLKLTRLRHYSAACLGKRLLALLRRPQNTKLSNCLSVIKHTFNQEDYTQVLANLIDKVNAENVLELYRFGQLESHHALTGSILTFCKNNVTLLASKFEACRFTLPQEIQAILYSSQLNLRIWALTSIHPESAEPSSTTEKILVVGETEERKI